ncbi:MAG: hypothetical protein MZV63_58595 [Marinilabiliales bacterium]|nr:hypothetical protein [Marinilabiliales bacterium]
MSRPTSSSPPTARAIGTGVEEARRRAGSPPCSSQSNPGRCAPHCDAPERGDDERFDPQDPGRGERRDDERRERARGPDGHDVAPPDPGFAKEGDDEAGEIGVGRRPLRFEPAGRGRDRRRSRRR